MFSAKHLYELAQHKAAIQATANPGGLQTRRGCIVSYRIASVRLRRYYCTALGPFATHHQGFHGAVALVQDGTRTVLGNAPVLAVVGTTDPMNSMLQLSPEASSEWLYRSTDH